MLTSTYHVVYNEDYYKRMDGQVQDSWDYYSKKLEQTIANIRTDYRRAGTYGDIIMYDTIASAIATNELNFYNEMYDVVYSLDRNYGPINIGDTQDLYFQYFGKINSYFSDNVLGDSYYYELDLEASYPYQIEFPNLGEQIGTIYTNQLERLYPLVELPWVTMQSNTRILKAGDVAIVNIQLSESSSDFKLADIFVGGGYLTNFTGSGQSYSVVFNPFKNIKTDGYLSIRGGSFSDHIGNFNTVGDSIEFTVNTLFNQLPTGSVTITGAAKQGQVLTARNTLADLDGLGTISYQWLSDGSDIGGATESALNLTQAQVGHAISVRASYIDGNGTVESATSAATASVTINVNHAPTGEVSIVSDATTSQMVVPSSVQLDGLGAGTMAQNSIANLPSGSSPRTYSAWVRMDPTDTSATVIGQGSINPSNFYYHSPLLIDFYPSSALVIDNVGHKLTLDFQVGYVTASTAVLNDNQWHMVTATFDPAAAGLGVSLYVDGSALSASAGVSGFNKNGVATINVNSSATYGFEYGVTNSATDSTKKSGVWIGAIADAGIWNSALTADQVLGLYTTPNALPQTGLVSTYAVTPEGAVSQGQTFTASNTLADADGLGTINYQWLSDGNVIDGATGSTLTLTQAQVGHVVSVRASYVDSYGTNESATSSASATVSNVNDSPTGAVSISGTMAQNQILTASNTLADLDGLGSISYQWLSDGNAIGGATASTFMLTQAQVGHAISVRASYTDGYGSTEIVTRSIAALVSNTNDSPVGSVIINLGDASDPPLLPPFTILPSESELPEEPIFAYCEPTEIPGIYIVRAGIVISLDRLQTSAVGNYGGLGYINMSGPEFWAKTVGGESANGIWVATSYSNNYRGTYAGIGMFYDSKADIFERAYLFQGQVLTAANTLSDLDGLGAINYQWLSDGNVISGATGSTCTLTQAQVGHAISVRASYIDGFGTVQSVTSSAIAPVANINDAPTGAVTISGIAAQNQILTASNTLADLDGLGRISYQWLSDGNVIDGATGSTFTVTEAQVGHAVSVRASYFDGYSSYESVTSNSRAIVVVQTAIDLAAPLLLHSNPIDNASTVVASSNLTLVFNEAIKAGNGNILLTNTLDASDNRTFSITDATQVTVSGSSVVINPSSDLLLGAHYAVTTAAGTLTDVAGNAFAGILDTTQLDFTVSSQKTKYFVLSSSANFTDFNLGYTSASLASEQVTFVGSSQVDAIFVRPGTPVDFTLSGAAADKIYLSGNLSDYTATISGSVMTLQRGADSTFESASFIKGTSAVSSDILIFANGTLSSFDLYNNLKNSTVLPSLGTSETSLAPLTSAASGLSATIKAFALNSAGDTFAPTSLGQTMITVGGAGVDTVYVPDGGVVDATLLGGGQDVIYFRGAWADYTKTLSGSVMTFNRVVDGHNESVKVVAGSSLSLNDQLTFADGTVHSYDAKVAIIASAVASIGAVTGLVSNTVTPGLVPSLKASALDNVTNFEITSDIVLSYSETVSAVDGKYIHIVNDGGNGFHGESTNNTLDILTSDTTQVTISGSRVAINPTADLDLANTYHIAVDAGAFTGVSSDSSTSAFDGTTSLNFSTVTPGTSSLANAAVSQTMDVNGVMTAGHAWLDIEGIGNPAATAGTPLDLSKANVALVTKDYDPTGAVVLAGYDGITTGDFYVAANNFAAGDLLYIDNQSALKNDLSLTSIVNPGRAPTTIQFAGNGGLGGLVDMTVAGTSHGFDDLASIKTYLNTGASPVMSG